MKKIGVILVILALVAIAVIFLGRKYRQQYGIPETENRSVVQQALMFGKVELCQDAGDQAAREECEDGYYMSKAIENSDFSLCQKIHDPKNLKTCNDAFVINKTNAMLTDPNFDCSQLPEDRRFQCQRMKSLQQ